MSRTFRVVLTGEVLSGFERDIVVMQLAALLKQSNAFAASLLQGKPAQIKEGLDQVRGSHYLSALTAIGVGVVLELSDDAISALESYPNNPARRDNQSGQKTQVSVVEIEPTMEMASKLPVLWNPDAAANWSLIFTPIFGATLHSRNWRVLNQIDKSRNAAHWVYATIAIYLTLIGWTYYSLNNGVQPPSLLLAAPVVWLFIWYFVEAKTQARFVSKGYAQYKRRGWFAPLSLAVVAALVFNVMVRATLAAAATDHKRRAAAVDHDPCNPFEDPNFDGKNSRCAQAPREKPNPYANPNDDGTVR